MRTAVDSSVFLDVLHSGSVYHDRSSAALKDAYDHGSIVVCDVVWSEVRANFNQTAKCDAVMTTIGAVFDPISREAADLAGMLWQKYRKSRGARSRLIPDFLVGAHARLQADKLLTRDRGFYRQYFSGMQITDPSVR